MTDQRWRGKTVTVSGPKGSMNVKINDAGPVARLHRVADLNPTAFQAVCGSLSKGICTVTITGP
jgi:expansin (peptidoglycan-binding protein)